MKRYVILIIVYAFVLLAVPGVPDHTATAESNDITALAEEFVRLTAAGDYSGAVERFDLTMLSAMPPGKLEETWRDLLTQVGAYQGQAGVRTEEWQQYRIAYVRCEFERSSLDIKVVFNRKGQISGLWFVPATDEPAPEYRPPAYADPESFHQTDVTVGSGEWALPGTMTMPVGAGPFPAVVLVHGSGPQDRDETIGPNKPFRDLAWGLASRGIAVLRYEKRTKEHAAKLAPRVEELTVREETVDDALAAATLLRETAGIDPGRLFILGHSLGGMLVPRIGQRDPDLAGFIVMAGTTRPLEEVIIEQMSYLYGLDGVITDHERAQIQRLEDQAAKVQDPSLSPATERGELPFGVSAAYWLDLRGYDPPAEAKKLGRPMLILQGGRDYQVTSADFWNWRSALEGEEQVTFKLYPELNHLFIEGEGKSTPAEYETPGNVAEFVVNDIAAWTAAH